MSRTRKNNLQAVDEDYFVEDSVNVSASSVEIQVKPDFGPIPSPPGDMDWRASQEWIERAPTFHEFGLLNGRMNSIFEIYCVMVGRAKEAEAMLQADGRIINGKRHPSCQEHTEASREVRALYAQLMDEIHKIEDRQSKERIAEIEAKYRAGEGRLESNFEKQGLLA